MHNLRITTALNLKTGSKWVSIILVHLCCLATIECTFYSRNMLVDWWKIRSIKNETPNMHCMLTCCYLKNAVTYMTHTRAHTCKHMHTHAHTCSWIFCFFLLLLVCIQATFKMLTLYVSVPWLHSKSQTPTRTGCVPWRMYPAGPCCWAAVGAACWRCGT